MSLLTKLNQWQVAPPPPTQEDNSGGGRNNEWDNLIFNQFDNLLWMIEEKHWKDTIHIGRDFISIGRLRHIPESYIRSLIGVLMADPDNRSFTKYIIRGS